MRTSPLTRYRNQIRRAGVIALIVALGCHGPTIPESDPYIRGTISFVDSYGYMVQNPAGCNWSGPACAAAQAYVSASTPIFWRAGGRAQLSDLVPGRVVSVWIQGPVLERLPPIVGAASVVIEDGH